jgi:hypothetical protein
MFIPDLGYIDKITSRHLHSIIHHHHQARTQRKCLRGGWIKEKGGPHTKTKSPKIRKAEAMYTNQAFRQVTHMGDHLKSRVNSLSPSSGLLGEKRNLRACRVKKCEHQSALTIEQTSASMVLALCDVKLYLQLEGDALVVLALCEVQFVDRTSRTGAIAAVRGGTAPNDVDP